MSPLDDDAWDAWSPHELDRRLREAALPWYVAGGWALDLWHEEQTREHEDLEFVVIRNHVDHFRAILHELDFFTVKDGAIEYLPPSANLPSDVWQLWGADMRHGCWRVDMMVEPGTPDLWIYKVITQGCRAVVVWGRSVCRAPPLRGGGFADSLVG